MDDKRGAKITAGYVRVEIAAGGSRGESCEQMVDEEMDEMDDVVDR